MSLTKSILWVWVGDSLAVLYLTGPMFPTPFHCGQSHWWCIDAIAGALYQTSVSCVWYIHDSSVLLSMYFFIVLFRIHSFSICYQLLLEMILILTVTNYVLIVFYLCFLFYISMQCNTVYCFTLLMWRRSWTLVSYVSYSISDFNHCLCLLPLLSYQITNVRLGDFEGTMNVRTRK